MESISSSPESLEVLLQIVPLLDSDVLDEIYPDLLAFSLSAIKRGSDEWSKQVVSFVNKIPALLEEIVDFVILLLVQEAHSKFNFVQRISQIGNTQQQGFEEEIECVQSEVLINTFRFLSHLFIDKALQSSDQLSRLDDQLVMFLGHKDDEVASECSKLMRWRVDSICKKCLSDDKKADFFWNTVWNIRRVATNRIHISNALIMWLRMLSCFYVEVRDNCFFQNNIVNQDFYWQFLQTGLASSSHEQRKFCLSILQLSIKSVNTSFETSIIKWDDANSSKLLLEWSRFTTLYEILGIDTSLHQLQAVTKDILYLMTPESLVHASWGFCLLSTGFQASMDSVRKATALILLELPDESLPSLIFGLPFLEKQFLPYMMLSRHFGVRRIKAESNELSCEYGKKFSRVLASIVRSMPTSEDMADVVRTILKVLISTKEAFDAVKIYTTWGIVKGLDGKQVLKFGIDDSLLVELFDSPTEGELYKTVVQTLNLRLILALQSTKLEEIIDVLLKFTNHNGYKLFSENLKLVIQYANTCGYTVTNFTTLLATNCSLNWAVILTILIDFCNVQHQFDSEVLQNFYGNLYFAKLVEASCRPLSLMPAIKSTVESTINQSSSVETYQALTQGLLQRDVSENIQLVALWEDVSVSLRAPTCENVPILPPKLQFLNRIIANSSSYDSTPQLEDIMKLLKDSFPKPAELARSLKGFYKMKNNIIGELHSLIKLLVIERTLSKEQVNVLLSTLHLDSAHPATMTPVCEIIKSLLQRKLIDTNRLPELIGNLLESIRSLNEDRFKLEDRDLHHLLIEIFLHSVILTQANEDSQLSDNIAQFLQIMISNAYARRGLLPKIMDCFLLFQVANSSSFEHLPFISRFLLEAIILRQLNNNVFTIEAIIATLFDESLSPKPSSDLYSEMYGAAEIAYKVKMFAILNSIKTSKLAETIFELSISKSSPLGNTEELKFNDGHQEYSRCQAAKLMVSIMDRVDLQTSKDKFLPKLFKLVETDPSPLVRLYLEWAIAYLLLKSPNLIQQVFDKLSLLLANHELKPVTVTIYERILFLAISSMSPSTEVEYLSQLIGIVVPAAATNKAVTRHFSMSLAISIHEEIISKKLLLDPKLLAIVNNMYSTAVSTNAFAQFRSGSACLWNVMEDFDLVHISGGLLLQLNNREVEHVTEYEFKQYLSKEVVANLNHPIGKSCKAWTGENPEASNPAFKEQSEKYQSPLQTKSGAWSTVMDVDKKTELADIVRSDLIVVASLVDKPPNLGGICRLCDVLGAGLITLHDMKVKEHPQFKNVAVTADHWMPMTEVKPTEIVKYLREKKADGYTLMGLEQTDKSVVLDSKLQFPKKTLILLGREKEGIPGELLAELDLCVEIKQVGVIRSMNIQTATAVIVHAYSSQNC